MMFEQRLEGPEEASFVNIQMITEKETTGLWGKIMQGISN